MALQGSVLWTTYQKISLTSGWNLSTESFLTRFSSSLRQSSWPYHTAPQRVPGIPSWCARKSHRQAWPCNTKLEWTVNNDANELHSSSTNLVRRRSRGATFSRRFQYVCIKWTCEHEVEQRRSDGSRPGHVRQLAQQTFRSRVKLEDLMYSKKREGSLRSTYCFSIYFAWWIGEDVKHWQLS